MIETDCISPKAKVIADRQVIFGVALMPGRHLLLLCGKSRQKRIKGGKETVRSGFPPSFENLLPFDRIADRLRTASVRGLTFSIALGSLRDVGA